MGNQLPRKSWQQGIEKFTQTVWDFDVEPQRTGLLLVDMQHYDAHPDYGVPKRLKSAGVPCADYYIPRLQQVVPNCAKLLKFFRQNRMRVFHACFGASMPDASDLLPLRKARLKVSPAFTTNDFEYQILEELKPEAGEYVFSKTTRNAFVGSGLDHKMRMIGIDTVVVAGAVTEVCVASTARGAWDLGYKVILMNDASAGFSEEDHNLAMRSFSLYFSRVMDVDELIAWLGPKCRPSSFSR